VNQPVHDMPPMMAALMTGVMPPVRSVVEARRLIDESASMMAFATSAPRRTPPRENTSS
jgi:hypothetical protein